MCDAGIAPTPLRGAASIPHAVRDVQVLEAAMRTERYALVKNASVGCRQVRSAMQRKKTSRCPK